MKNPAAWIDGKPVGNGWSVDFDKYIEEVSDGLFHVGQSYESNPVGTLQCKKCGGKEFNVGQGSYLTVIRCVKCEYEICIHDG